VNPRDLFDAAGALFLDFDGPIAALMPPPVNEEAAAVARRAAQTVDLPIEIATTADHLAVLRWVRLNCPDEVLGRVEAACTKVELEAAQSCDESPDAAILFDYAINRGIPLAIVSNNAEAAVRRFLDRRNWGNRITTLACRTSETVDSLKPSPQLLLDASDAVGVPPARALFVGDSVSDVHAGRDAGIPVLGIAKHQRRSNDLLEAGAEAVVERGTVNQILR